MNTFVKVMHASTCNCAACASVPTLGMPEGFCRNHKYDAKIMEEVGRKVIHLLEEIYGRKASPEIWALNNFKEFEVWYDTNKKELEANARKKGPKGKTAAKKAA